MRTDSSPKLTLVSGTGGQVESGNASSPFGLLSQGLIRQQTTHEVQLEVLLSTLEKRVAMLESKFLGVITTFLSDTAHLVEPGNGINDTGGTKYGYE